jgi:hypothetical protein
MVPLDNNPTVGEVSVRDLLEGGKREVRCRVMKIRKREKKKKKKMERKR